MGQIYSPGDGYTDFQSWEDYVRYYTRIVIGRTPVTPNPTSVKTTTPAQGAVPAAAANTSTSPSVKYTLDYILNRGWNSWARSLSELAKGDFVECSVMTGISGAFFGVGVRGKEGHGIGSYSHGILADPSGVWVVESGVLVEQLTTATSAATNIRIIRHPNNTVLYMAITGTESILYESAVASQNTTLYVYGYLYSSGDTINDAALTTGQVQFGSA